MELVIPIDSKQIIIAGDLKIEIQRSYKNSN